MGNLITAINPLNAFGGNVVGRYGFGLIDIKAGNVLPDTDYAPGAILLRLNPQTIDQDEPFASQLTPTVAGIGIETRGQLMKECVLTGTVGFLPSPNRPINADSTFIDFSSVTSKFEDIVPYDTRVRTLAEQSGYKDFLQLRNLFRRYAMIKSAEDTSPDSAYASDAIKRGDVRLVFRNYKDQEFWIAEPRSFRMPQRRGLTYNYQIAMTLVEPYHGTEFVQWETEVITSGEYESPLGRALRVVNTLREAMTSIQELAISTGQSIVSYYASIANAGIGIVADALDTFAVVMKMPANVTKQMVFSTAANLRNLIEAAENIESIDIEYKEAWYQSYEALLTLTNDTRYYVDSTPERYENSYRSLLSETSKVIANAEGSTNPLPDGVTTGIAYGGENIFDMARRLLGDASRYVEIVYLNNLRPPYVSETAGERPPHTLAPGDTVLLPANAPRRGGTVELDDQPLITGTAWTAVPYGAGVVLHSEHRWPDDEYVGYTVDMTDEDMTPYRGHIIKNEGNAFVVYPAPAGARYPLSWRIRKPGIDVSDAQREQLIFGVDVARTNHKDLTFTARGDLALVTGNKNFQQALEMKLDTEQTTLPMHTWYGLIRRTGSKGTPRIILETQINVTRTLQSDTRIASVLGVDALLDQDKLYIEGRVLTKVNSVQSFQRSL